MKRIIVLTLVLILTACTAEPVLALFGIGESSNVGTDWTNTDKNLNTSGNGTIGGDLSVSGDGTVTGDFTITGDLTTDGSIDFNAHQLRTDYDYTSLTVAFNTIGAVTPTRLQICQYNVIPDGVTLTQTSNIILDFNCGGSIDGIAGGATETLALSGEIIKGTGQSFGDNLTVSGSYHFINTPVVQTLAALSALPNQNISGFKVCTAGRSSDNDGGEGCFLTTTSDISAEVAIDTESAIYVPHGSDPTGAGGGWVRQWDGQTVHLRWAETSAGALVAVSEGGTLFITGEVDVATWGVIDSTKAINIKGAGWAIGDGGATDVTGAVILNSGGDVVDFPCITIGGGSSIRRGEITGLVIWHEGETSPAISVEGELGSAIHDNYIFGNDLGYQGIAYSGSSFFARAEDNDILRFTSHGIFNNSTGSDHEFDKNHVAGTADGFIGIETRCNGTLIRGGEIEATGTGSIGIKFYSATAVASEGGLVDSVFFENTQDAIVIDGNTAAFRRVDIVRARFNMGAEILGYGVRFERAEACQFLNPQLGSSTGGTALVYWGANSKNCTVKGPFNLFAGGTFTTHASALRAKLLVSGVLGYATAVTVSVTTNLLTVIENVTELVGPLTHNGTAWYKQRETVADDTAVAYTPPSNRGILTVITSSAIGEYAKVMYDVAAGTLEAFDTGTRFEINATDGTLDGTTGTDNKITVRADSASGNVYIENRRGGNRVLTSTFTPAL